MADQDRKDSRLHVAMHQSCRVHWMDAMEDPQISPCILISKALVFQKALPRDAQLAGEPTGITTC
jgi:hypothetical protein